MLLTQKPIQMPRDLPRETVRERQGRERQSDLLHPLEETSVDPTLHEPLNTEVHRLWSLEMSRRLPRIGQQTISCAFICPISSS